jgi:hypothetical protein
MAAQGGARPDPVEVSGPTNRPTAGQPVRPAPDAEPGAYLRLTRGRFDPAAYEEVVRLTGEIAAATEQLPGYRSQHHGVDRGGGTLVAVSLWDSAEHARFSREALGPAHAAAVAAGVWLEPPEVYPVVP